MIPGHTVSANPSEPAAGAERGVSIVIPSWNGRTLLERFLPSVAGAAAAFESACRQPAEIVVADDASDDDTCGWLATHHPRVRVESANQRAGFAPTANRGVRAARFPLAYVVNNDVALDGEALPPLAAHFETGIQSPRVFAVSSQVYNYDTGKLTGAGQLGEFRRGFVGIHRRYLVEQPAAVSERPWLTLFATGGSSMFDRSAFLELGGFDESFAPFGWEDVELSLRAWKQGFEVHYEPRSAVWHQFSSTIKPAYRSRYVQAIYERNRLLAHWYHLDTIDEKSSHGAFLALKLLGSIFNGHWELWRATAQALARCSVIRNRRQEATTHCRVRLRAVLDRVAAELDRSGARLLDGESAPSRPWRGVRFG
ncbi:MAG TPA: glycosyltransferase [Terriglobia bacterium]|nr:glycosyltransferase [Terriglobia bacterium]